MTPKPAPPVDMNTTFRRFSNSRLPHVAVVSRFLAEVGACPDITSTHIAVIEIVLDNAYFLASEDSSCVDVWDAIVAAIRKGGTVEERIAEICRVADAFRS
jgi:hypothetical protein